jgi:hypothetical protein
MFSHGPSLFLFFLEIYFDAPHEKTYLLSPSFAVLIRGLKGGFFIWGSKINFQEKKLKTWNGKGKT